MARIRKIEKPYGVYVWPILILVAYTLLPFLGPYPSGEKWIFVSLGALPFNGSLAIFEGPDGETSFILVFISVLLRIMTGAAAVWAFVGHNEGRISLLAFLTLNYVWWMSLTIIIISSLVDTGPGIISVILELVRPTIWIAILWWYFSKKDVVAYYKQES